MFIYKRNKQVRFSVKIFQKKTNSVNIHSWSFSLELVKDWRDLYEDKLLLLCMKMW